MHKQTLALALLIPVVFSPVTATELEARNAQSRKTIQEFGKKLKGELVSAIKAGGPVNAIGVCNLKAPEIAQTVSVSHDLEISRTSLKYRNPKNAPISWQQAVLENFESRLAAGAAPETLEYSEIVDTDSGKEYRYMKAIPTADVCLTCHGKDIADNIKAKLSELYPEDKATGYNKGDIRGAFVIVD